MEKLDEGIQEFFVILCNVFISLKLFQNKKFKNFLLKIFKCTHLGMDLRLQETETYVRDGVFALAKHYTDINK